MLQKDSLDEEGFLVWYSFLVAEHESPKPTLSPVIIEAIIFFTLVFRV